MGNQSIQSAIADADDRSDEPDADHPADRVLLTLDPRVLLGRRRGRDWPRLPVALRVGHRGASLLDSAVRRRAGPSDRGRPTAPVHGGAGRPWRTGRAGGSPPRAATRATGRTPNTQQRGGPLHAHSLQLAPEARAAVLGERALQLPRGGGDRARHGLSVRSGSGVVAFDHLHAPPRRAGGVLKQSIGAPPLTTQHLRKWMRVCGSLRHSSLGQTKGALGCWFGTG